MVTVGRGSHLFIRWLSDWYFVVVAVIRCSDGYDEIKQASEQQVALLRSASVVDLLIIRLDARMLLT